jgi:hypothetical protein
MGTPAPETAMHEDALNILAAITGKSAGFRSLDDT